MNHEPVQPVQLPEDDDHQGDAAKAACVVCDGFGKAFFQLDADHRKEIPCHACGGSGLLTDAALRILTGEYQRQKSESKSQEYKDPEPQRWGV